MRILDLVATRDFLAREPGKFRPARVDGEAVRQTMVAGDWPHGPLDDAAEFETWLWTIDQPEGDIDDIDVVDSGRIMALALHYMTTRYPRASQLDLASCCGLLAGYATGWPVAYGDTDDTPKARWVQGVVFGMLGGSGGPDMWTMPERIVGVEPAMLVRMTVSVMESLFFLPGPGGDIETTVREAVDLLHATRSTFRSKQIERARQLLEGLLR